MQSPVLNGNFQATTLKLQLSNGNFLADTKGFRMNILTPTLKTLALGLALGAALLAPQTAQAQAGTTTHTFVSGTGADSNPCTAASPCLTFSGALAQTAPGGTITALDPGDYGQATISHAVTIDGTGTLAAVSLPPNLILFSPVRARASTVGPTSAGLTVNPGATTDVVVLRGLSFTGAANTVGQTAGISLSAPGTLLVEDCHFSQFTQAAINLGVNAGTVVVKKCAITSSAGAFGILIGNGAAGASTLLASIKDSVIQGTSTGILANSGMADISQTLITQNTTAGLQAASGATLSASGCMISGNGTGALGTTGAVIRLTDNDFYNNNMALMSGGGILSTTANNRRAGNATTTNPPSAGDSTNRGITQQ